MTKENWTHYKQTNRTIILNVVNSAPVNNNINNDPQTDNKSMWNSIKLIIDSTKLTLNCNNYKSTKKTIGSLLRTSQIIQHEDQWKINNINKYINERNDNLVHNQKRMINSILDRKPQRIHLDRLQYTDLITKDLKFTNDPKIIEQQTIQHFQLLGQTRTDVDNIPVCNNISELPPYWQPLYQPIQHKHKHQMI
ncbi:unnamed protein product [Rhizophagus irregularis]|uniref:Uncharacterized protein n=1 Tax=Rhizophagus irregularis TaxID=588596 RepID=A0A2I1H8G1_9GLOM|nr:hypothetical protein RhiirA4_474470 [Rhizophagus irregularis]CAB4402955.1 unnamed protein product [Rhizophagus irregularis]